MRTIGPKCWIIYATPDLVVARIICAILAESGIEPLIGPHHIDISNPEWLSWAERTAQAVDFAIVLVSEASSPKNSSNVTSEITLLRVEMTRNPKLFVCPLSLSKSIDFHEGLPNVQAVPLWSYNNPTKWLRTEFLPGVVYPKLLASSCRSAPNYGWRAVSAMLDARAELRERLDSEGFFHLLTIDSAVALAFWPGGLEISRVWLKRASGTFEHHPIVAQALGGRISGYSGPNKFLLKTWGGGTTDVPDLTLGGFSVPPDKVKVAHEHFGSISASFGRDLKLFNVEQSQVPNFLVLHAISTTSEDDEVILLTRRRETVAYYPSYWTASWEEQLNVDQDEWAVETGLLRGAKEEIIGRLDAKGALIISLFREFDDRMPTRSPKGTQETNCLTGLALYAPLQVSYNDILANWWRAVDASHEFTDLVGIRLTWPNIEALLRVREFDFSLFPDGVRFPPGTETQHLRLRHQQLHPTARMRLLGLASMRFPLAFEAFVESARQPA